MTDPEVIECVTDDCGFRGSRKVLREKYGWECPLCGRGLADAD
jgi:hypothetical protein